MGTNPIEFSVEDSAEAAQPVMWKVYKAGVDGTYAFSENYRQESSAIHAVDVVRSGNVTYEVWQSSVDQNWRWRIIGLNGEQMARSGYFYSSRSRAQDAADSVRMNAPTAPVRRRRRAA